MTNGEKITQITKYLQSIGVKTKRGNLPDRRFVDYILNNPLYCGKIRWSTDGRMASKRDFATENLIIADGIHEPIITEEIFNKAQEIIQDNRKKYGKYQRPDQPVDFMLKGLMKCSNCGATLVLSKFGVQGSHRRF